MILLNGIVILGRGDDTYGDARRWRLVVELQPI